MKHLLFILLFIVQCSMFTVQCYSQSVGQYELRKRTATGFTSYGITLSNGQVLGQTAGVPAAITPFDGAFSSLSGTPTTLAGYGITNGLTVANNLSDLASAATARTNLGLGSLSTLGAIASAQITDGTIVNADISGTAAIDVSKFNVSANVQSLLGAATFSAFRALLTLGVEQTAVFGNVEASSVTTSTEVSTAALKLTGNGFTTTIEPTATANRSLLAPDLDGTLLVSTSTIPLSQLAQTAATSGQAVVWNGSAWAPATIATGLTVGTTTTSGAASGDILTSNGTLLQKLTPGTGVSTWLATPSKANLNAAVSDDDPAYVGAANTFSAAQTIASGTITASAPALTLTQTWNNGAVAFTGLDLNITETAAAGASTYMRVRTSRSSADVFRLQYSQYGTYTDMILGGTTSNASTVMLRSAYGVCDVYASYLTINSDSGTGLAFRASNGVVRSYLSDYASGKMMQHNNTAASQSFGVANTYTSATSYEALVMDWLSNVGRVGTQKGSGGGSAREWTLVYDSTEKARVSSAGFTIGSTGSAIASIKRASVTLVAGTATVSDTSTTANSEIVMSVVTPAGTVGFLDFDLNPGTGYTINSSNVLDLSTIIVTAIHFP